jgi:hypothetical protein
VIDYLDYLRHQDNHVEDDGYESSNELAQHFTFGGKAIRLSDLAIPVDGCDTASTKPPPLFDDYWSRPERNNWEEYDKAEIKKCPRCGWWQVSVINYREPSSFVRETNRETYTGVARVFPLSAHSVIDELARLINTDNPQLSAVDPGLFEKALAEVFRHYYRASEVRHLGRSGDGGIDLYCVIDDETYLIQVKRRMNGKVEEVVTVRELVGAYVLAPFEITTPKRSVHVITTAPRISMPELTPSSRERLATNQLTISGHAFEQAKEMLNLAAGRVAEPWLHIPFAREIRDRCQKEAQTSS